MSVQASLECAIDYAVKRQSFGMPIAKMQTIQVRLCVCVCVCVCVHVCVYVL